MGVNVAFTPISNQMNTIYINEAGLYQLIMKSKLPIADKFQDWVTGDLLPKIRKIGQCCQDNYLESLPRLLNSTARYPKIEI